MAGRLLFTSRGTEVRSVPLADGQVVVIGRGPGCDVRFADMNALSRLHCRVRAAGGRAWVERLYCRGEIRVEGTAIAGAHEMKAGDVVTLLGDLAFRFDLTPDERMRARVCSRG